MIMLHTGAIADRFDHPAAASRHLVERCQALLRPAFLTLAKAWIARRDAPLRMEMSCHMLKDIGIERDDIRRAGASRHAQWP